ncbi:maleylpyruvate isomerase family mycothiol-dependent enzyme [Amycolatopsis sp. cg5]|uniref:maleylpyruvate isomerase family mycothiol-dependent enzyme n=1 Tax=Amycolatopsis sp. cg5 TaxID=3238802 RepID=UPI003525B16A
MTVHPLPFASYVDAIEAETALIAEAVDGADLGATVPSCPDWTLAHLTEHVGMVQRWFTKLLAEDTQERPASREVETGLPLAPGQHPGWLLAGAAKARAVLDELDPNRPMWTWGADGRAQFWARRMLFETLVHRWDAELTVGKKSIVDTTLAADGVDEYLVNMPHSWIFAPKTANLRGKGEVIAFHSTDTGEEWHVQLREDSFGLIAGGLPDMTVKGTAVDLLLFLVRRTTDLPYVGSRELYELWTANSDF